ncbi:nitroreductase family deazaflavin-dependent oxidoreductase [Salsipaludibacter albus]|uniref:nitroreductase family deazaflavin-dependent oxidoreductase n=1 Tax=Salsipaludibacter albus TaxID=2849650 RepID=UPI001EE4359E
MEVEPPRGMGQRMVTRFAASGPGSWVFARLLHHVDRPVHRLSRGRHTATSLVSGLPVAMVTTTGARSGQSRTVPLVAVPTSDGLAVVASNYGQPRHPGWYHNLVADPHGTVSVDGRSWSFRAELAEGARRDRIWARCLRIYPGFATYTRRAADRDIAVFVLLPT